MYLSRGISQFMSMGKSLPFHCCPQGSRATRDICPRLLDGITQPLQEIPARELDEFLFHFILEARRQDGSPYPATSLYQLVCELQRYLRDNDRPEVAFFDEKQPIFD